MKKLLTGWHCRCAFALAMAGMARADILIATAGPMTGQYAAFGAADEGAAPSRRSTTSTPPAACSARSSSLEVGDDACDPKQAVAVANQLVAKGVVFVAGHFCSGSSIPAS